MNEKYQGGGGLFTAYTHHSSQPFHSFTILLLPLIPKTNKVIMQKKLVSIDVIQATSW